jgi:hypothetical protein
MMLNPGVGPAPNTQPQTPPQTAHSQYLQAALKQLSQQQVSSPAQAGMGLLSSALLQHAQQAQDQYGADGGNAQKNAASDALAGSMAKAGVPFQQSPALPTSAPNPLSGLMGLGKSAMGGLGSMFRGG